jgi:hypothetical protein
MNMMRFVASAALLAAASFASAQEPLPPIQFNVPYVCANGLTYVIERCEVRGRGEVCFFHTETKGQPPHENINIRSQLTAVVKTCPAAAAPKPASPAAVPLGIPTGRPTDPPHLREMPPADRVLSEIQGSNPADTLARQLRERSCPKSFSAPSSPEATAIGTPAQQ